MTTWVPTTLGKVLADKGYIRGPFGSALKRDEMKKSGIPVYEQKNAIYGDRDFRFYIGDEKFEELKRFQVKTNDLIISCSGTVGKISIINEEDPKGIISQALLILRADINKVTLRYLYYLLSSSQGFELLTQASHGSVQVNIAERKVVEQIPLLLPTVQEQKAIAAVLSSLDDKIDLLHRQNKTLESMAASLFRQWFVEEAQEDWEFVELGNYVSCFNGVSYKSDDLNPSTTAMVTLKSFERDGGFRLDGFKEFTGKYKEQHVVNQGDLVVAHTDITQDAAVIGNPVLVVPDPAYVKLVISMDLVKVTSKHEWLSNEFLYLLMRTREFKQHCLGHSNGSTVLHLSKTAIPTYDFLMPPKDKINEFTKLAKGLLGKKFENISQTMTLEKLRDTLLPKLMSGEIRVAF